VQCKPYLDVRSSLAGTRMHLLACGLFATAINKQGYQSRSPCILLADHSPVIFEHINSLTHPYHGTLHILFQEHEGFFFPLACFSSRWHAWIQCGIVYNLLIFICFVLLYIHTAFYSFPVFFFLQEQEYSKSQSLHSSLASFQRADDGEADEWRDGVGDLLKKGVVSFHFQCSILERLMFTLVSPAKHQTTQ
jgi:hypothetical protein